jgi:hypothetical protein
MAAVAVTRSLLISSTHCKYSRFVSQVFAQLSSGQTHVPPLSEVIDAGEIVSAGHVRLTVTGIPFTLMM